MCQRMLAAEKLLVLTNCRVAQGLDRTLSPPFDTVTQIIVY